MSWLDEIEGPSEADLWAIELDSELLAAEVTLIDAEAALVARPCDRAVAAYLQALLDLIDLHDFGSHDPAAIDSEGVAV